MKRSTNLVLQQRTNTWFHQKMNFISMTLCKHCIVGAASLETPFERSFLEKKLYMRWGWLLIHLTHNSTNLKMTLPTQRPTFGVRCVMSFTKPAMCRQKWNVLVKSSPPEHVENDGGAGGSHEAPWSHSVINHHEYFLRTFQTNYTCKVSFTRFIH